MRLRDDSGDAQGSRHRFPTYRPRSPNRMESSIRFGIRRNAGKREELTMRVIGNILWIILGGLAIAISWALIGLFLCITIIGIPLGVQAFKMAGLTLTPFGKTVQYGGGVGSTLANILWVVLVGWWMATRLSGCRRAQLHHHHRHPVRHPVVQNGQACALAVRRTDLQSVTIVSAVSPVQRIIIVRCTGLFIYNGHFTHRVI